MLAFFRKIEVNSIESTAQETITCAEWSPQGQSVVYGTQKGTLHEGSFEKITPEEIMTDKELENPRPIFDVLVTKLFFVIVFKVCSIVPFKDFLIVLHARMDI